MNQPETSLLESVVRRLELSLLESVATRLELRAREIENARAWTDEERIQRRCMVVIYFEISKTLLAIAEEEATAHSRWRDAMTPNECAAEKERVP